MAFAPKPLGRARRRRATDRVLGSAFSPSAGQAGPAIAGDSNHDSVLLVGSGALNGWGVAELDDAIPGHLARALYARTDRPVRVELLNEPTATCADLPGMLDTVDLLDFDAVAVVIGVSDALKLTPERSWCDSVVELLKYFETTAASSLSLVVMGMQPPSTVPLLDVPPGGQVDRHAEALNARTEGLCEGRASFLMPPVVAVMGPRAVGADDPAEMARASNGYRAWAEELAERLALLRQTNRAWAH